MFIAFFFPETLDPLCIPLSFISNTVPSASRTGVCTVKHAWPVAEAWWRTSCGEVPSELRAGVDGGGGGGVGGDAGGTFVIAEYHSTHTDGLL